MGIETAAIIGGAALLGGVAGSQKDKAKSSSQSSNVSQVFADPASADEKQAREIALNSLTSLEERLKALESSPILSNLDRLMAELGQMPNQNRIDQANQFATQMFAPQQEALNQAFEQQSITAAQRAAQLGRSSADPILAAKLAQEQIRMQRSFDAEKGAFAASEAVNAPARLFQNQLGALSGLSGQAIQNRQAVYSLGSDFANNLQQYRLATATRTGQSSGTQSMESGGGFKGAITGMLGGAGAGVMMGQAGGLWGGK